MEHRDQLPPRKPRKTPPNWDQILNGTAWDLRTGEDTEYTRSTFRTYAYKEARRRGGHAKVITPSNDPTLIHIKFSRYLEP